MCFKKGMDRIFDAITKIVCIYTGCYLVYIGFINYEQALIYGKPDSELYFILMIIYLLCGFFGSLLVCKLTKTFFMYIYEGFAEE